jgi:hypothetical protein
MANERVDSITAQWGGNGHGVPPRRLSGMIGVAIALIGFADAALRLAMRVTQAL